MIVEVEMLAFGEPGEIRKVHVPESTDGEVERVLDLVFKWGQNDFQPQRHPSVSAGDVIRYGGEAWLVAWVGFKKITEEQLARYRSLGRDRRHIGRYELELEGSPETP